MTIIRRAPSPFGDLLSLRQAMDRLFEESFVRPGVTWGEGGLVPMDVYATDDDFVLEANLPGVKPEEVDITVENNTLTISGEGRYDPAGDPARSLHSDPDPARRAGARQGQGHVRGRRADSPHPQGRAGQAAPDQDHVGQRP